MVTADVFALTTSAETQAAARTPPPARRSSSVARSAGTSMDAICANLRLAADPHRRAPPDERDSPGAGEAPGCRHRHRPPAMVAPVSAPSAAAPAGSAYLRLVLLGAAVGIPAALVGALFLALVHELEHWLWHPLPGESGSPEWYLVIGLPVVRAVIVVAGRPPPPRGGRRPPPGAGGAPRRWRGCPRSRRRCHMRPASRWPRSARSPSAPCSAPRL